MAKHPVPKYKKSKPRSKRRYHSFTRKTQVKLQGVVNLVTCTHCNETKLNHHVCLNCGYYGEKKILDMDKKIDKITKVKA